MPMSRDPVVHESHAARGGITVLDILSVFLRYRVLILILGALLAAMKAQEIAELPRYYQTEAEFMPQGARTESQLSGIARQFGINIGGGGGDNPMFYVDLLKSRTILGEVAKKQYEFRTDSGVTRGNLIEIFGGRNLKPVEQGPFVVGRLKSLITVGASGSTGVITIKVRALHPELAVQIANNLLVQVNTFNLQSRQARAAAERAFVEARQAEAQAELRQAEAHLQAFLVQNRDFTRSPALQMEYSRLTRAVEMRQTVYTGLAGAYEQAKIEEVRDLPVITVIAKPELPLDTESKEGARKVVTAFVGGLGFGSLLAFGLAGLAASTRRHPNDATEFDRLQREALGDLTHPWRPFVRMFLWVKRRLTPT